MSKFLKGRIMAVAAILASLLLSLLVLSAAVLAAPGAEIQDLEPGQEELSQAIQAAVAWLVDTHQNADGGYSSFSAGADMAPSDIGGTLDAIWALSLGGADTSAPVAYLESNADQLADYVAQDGSTAGKALLALSPAVPDVSDFAGLNLVLSVTDHLSPTGQFGVNSAFNQSLAMLGLAIAGHSVPDEAVEWLLEQQAADGDFISSWDDGFGTLGNPDSTALALLALMTSGRSIDDPAIQAGLDFLQRAQLDSGGWEYGLDFGENANSTAMVVLALSGLGEDLASEDSRWVKDGVDPVTALLAWQGESGAFQADLGDGRSDDFFSTVQVLPALGFHRLRMERGPLQAPVVDAPQEMTPTFTPTAVEPTATPEPPTATPEPTEAPPADAAEAVAAETDAGQAGTDAGGGQAASEVAVADSAAQGEAGSSILPWIIGIGAVIVVVGLVWWVLSRRQEA